VNGEWTMVNGVFMEPTFEILLSFRCDAPFIVLFFIEQLRRFELIGKFVEGVAFL